MHNNTLLRLRQAKIKYNFTNLKVELIQYW